MEKENTLSRRDFIIKAGKAVGLAMLSGYTPSLKASDLFSFSNPPVDLTPQKHPDLLRLESYLASLKSDQERLTKIVTSYDIFKGFKNYTEAERIDDLNRYFPIYRAVDLKYQIPWLLLWIMHADETDVSRNPDPNSGGPQKGALQVSRDNKGLDNPAAGWEFLSLLPNQRYSDDWEELFRGGLYIRRIADDIKNLSREDAVLDVVKFNYSAVQHGKARANQYLRVKDLFN